MKESWREVELGDVADLSTGFPFRSQFYTDDEDAPRLVGGDNIVQGALRWDNARRWPRNMLNGLEPFWLSEGDIVLAMDRPWIEAGLKRAVMTKWDLPALLVQRTARLRGTEVLDLGFLRYVVGSGSFAQYLLRVQTGTAVPHISLGQIRAFRFTLPSMEYQRAIASILGALDDKIELNRRMNDTLEELTRTIFKSWFVDFDPVKAKAEGRQPEGMNAETAKLFPSRFVESDLAMIPEGWEVTTLNERVDFLAGYPFRSELFSTEPVGVRLLKGSNVGVGQADWSTTYYWPLPLDKRTVECSLQKGDLLLAMDRPWIPAGLKLLTVGSCDLPALLVQRVARLRGTKQLPGSLLSRIMKDDGFTRHILNVQTGTTVPHISKDNILGYRIALADAAVATAFDTYVAPLDAQILNSRDESTDLASLRDALLPKLISGEIRISDAEAIVGDYL